MYHISIISVWHQNYNNSISLAGEKKNRLIRIKKINKTAKMFNCVSKEHSVVE